MIERMQVEQGLYVAQARAEITRNSIGDAVISADMCGSVDYLNVAAEKITGWTRGRRAAIPSPTSSTSSTAPPDTPSPIPSNTSCTATGRSAWPATVLVGRGGKRINFGATGVDPACLQLELTESVSMRDVGASADLPAKRKAMDVWIAVDDVGTGDSSLSYLNQFPIDVLKIDQSFVRAIDAGAGGNGAIVSAVIGMGKNLRHRVVAEGVGDQEQLAFLMAHDCNEAQGYWFSRPVDPAATGAMPGAGVCA